MPCIRMRAKRINDTHTHTHTRTCAEIINLVGIIILKRRLFFRLLRFI